jgi:hypothetical protein
VTQALKSPAGTALAINPISEKPSPLKFAEKPGYSPGLVGEQVEVGGHAAHRVDLTAELRHEERVHDRRRGEPEPDRCSSRDDQVIDRGDTLIGVDEQPFPIERHNVDP